MHKGAQHKLKVPGMRENDGIRGEPDGACVRRMVRVDRDANAGASIPEKGPAPPGGTGVAPDGAAGEAVVPERQSGEPVQPG